MTTDQTSPVHVIFGAGGGIGGALASRLSASGARIILAGRSQPSLDRLAALLHAETKLIDVTHPDQVDQCLVETLETHGRIDGVANCVGSLLLKPAHLTSDAEWSATLLANLTSAFHVLRASTSRMMRSGGGSIVLMSSAVAQRGMINHEAIAAAKAGVVGLAQSAAATYARYNIRVNCVAPGLTRTPLTESLTRNESSLKASAALHPLGRIGEPHEVASAIAWLLDPEQCWVTGQVIAVDGGLSSVQPRLVATA
jgi:NAD(P)-dependent dehydrogenase (short-subunit alcohol dehydrogenase family)